MAWLKNQKIQKITLTIILAWATVFFWLLNPVFSANVLITILSVCTLACVFFEKSAQLTVIYLSFIVAFVLYGYLQVNNMPIWLIMIGIMLIYLYLFSYLEREVKFSEDERPIFLLVFSLVPLETFFFLGYFFISPINRSLLLALTMYLVYGFCDTVINKKNPKGFGFYILVFAAIFVTMLLTASWGQV